jgi:hypothetical protein
MNGSRDAVMLWRVSLPRGSRGLSMPRSALVAHGDRKSTLISTSASGCETGPCGTGRHLLDTDSIYHPGRADLLSPCSCSTRSSAYPATRLHRRATMTVD